MTETNEISKFKGLMGKARERAVAANGNAPVPLEELESDFVDVAVEEGIDPGAAQIGFKKIVTGAKLPHNPLLNQARQK